MFAVGCVFVLDVSRGGLFALGLVAFILLGLGFVRIQRPKLAHAIKRLDETLKGRPLFSLLDRPADGDPILWALEQARLAKVTKSLRPHFGKFQISDLDPYGLRLIALLVFLCGVIWGTPRLGMRSPPDIAKGAVAQSGPNWEGWIIPPEFTGKPPIYLPDVLEDERIPVFKGSVIELRSYNEDTAWLEHDVSDAPVIDGLIQRVTVEQSGKLSVLNKPIKSWTITLEQDQPPTVQITGNFTSEFFGNSELPYAAQDDFGVVEGRLLVELDEATLDRIHGLKVVPDQPPKIEAALSMPLRGSRQDFADVASNDFSKSVLAHMPVRVGIEVSDGAGNVSWSEPLFTTLPARRFFDPLAASIIEIRRDIMWSAQNDKRALRMMRAILYRPRSEFRRETHYLLLKNIADRWDTSLMMGINDKSQKTFADDLWSLAIAIEEGDVDDALERMREAQERLSEAIKNGATPEEIAKLMQDLKAANENYIRQLRQQAERDMAELTPEERSVIEQDDMVMSDQDLQEMLDRIQELMDEGRMAEAMQALDEFQKMIENMQIAQSQKGDGGKSPGETMEDLSQTLREQQELSDRSFEQLQNQFNGEPSDNGDALGQQQRELQNQLREQRGKLPQLDGKAARDAQRSLRQSEEAMNEAGEALENGDFQSALDKQAEAMDSLRDGIRNFDQAMSENSEQGQGASQQNAGGERSDPLGRSQGVGGQDGNSDTSTGTAEAEAKNSEIMDEIRRRSGDLERSEKERSYLKRLLDRF